MSDLKNKRIITAAVTGAWPKKENNPNVPMTPSEIADDVYACWKAGAAIAHLHMRDDEGNGTMDHNKFKETVDLIHERYPDCDIILNLTTSGDIHADDETRVQHVKELKPEMASYDCGSMNWLNTSLFINSPKFLEDCGKLFQETNTKPEIEAFDPGMIANAAYYLKKGVIKAPLHFQFCMGCANGIPGSVKNLVFMKETMDQLCPGSTWSCFGVGHSAMEIMYAAIALGGNIRVGMAGTLGVELARFGIRVNSVGPGYVATDLVRQGVENGTIKMDRNFQVIPEKRFIEVEEIASIVAFLASDESSAINGQNIIADLGWSKNALPEDKDME